MHSSENIPLSKGALLSECPFNTTGFATYIYWSFENLMKSIFEMHAYMYAIIITILEYISKLVFFLRKCMWILTS